MGRSQSQHPLCGGQESTLQVVTPHSQAHTACSSNWLHSHFWSSRSDGKLRRCRRRPSLRIHESMCPRRNDNKTTIPAFSLPLHSLVFISSFCSCHSHTSILLLRSQADGFKNVVSHLVKDASPHAFQDQITLLLYMQINTTSRLFAKSKCVLDAAVQVSCLVF